jgi:hypothetical protein
MSNLLLYFSFFFFNMLILLYMSVWFTCKNLVLVLVIALAHHHLYSFLEQEIIKIYDVLILS